MRREQEQGSTLVSVIVIAAVAGVIMLAISSFSTFFARSTRSVGLSQEFNQLASSVALVLNNETACTKALEGQTFNAAQLKDSNIPQNLDKIELNGGTIAEVGQPPLGLKVTYLKFDKLLADLGQNSEGLNGHQVQLNLKAEKTSPGDASPIGNRFHESTFQVVLWVEGNLIKKCY